MQHLDAGSGGETYHRVGYQTTASASGMHAAVGSAVSTGASCKDGPNRRADRARRAGVLTWWEVVVHGILTAFAGARANAQHPRAATDSAQRSASSVPRLAR